MLFDFAKIPPRDCYKLLISTVTPRPIAWVVSQDEVGVVNAAPFSFFNVFSGDPPVVGVGVGSRAPGRLKDTRANVEALGEFVVNLVSEENARGMNVTAVDFPPQVDELHEAGLTAARSAKVRPPRIAESPVAMECKLMQVVKLGTTNALILGEVVAMHIHDKLVLDPARFYVDTPNLRLLGRLHGSGWYARSSDLFEMPRMSLEEVSHAGADRRKG